MKHASPALTMHSMCMCNADCLGNSCLLLVLSRSVTPRATGHAHRPRLNLSKHTHPSQPRVPGLASSALASAVLCGPGQLRRHRGCSTGTPSRAMAMPAPAGPQVRIQNGLRSRKPAVWNTTVSAAAPPVVHVLVRTGIPGTLRVSL